MRSPFLKASFAAILLLQSAAAPEPPADTTEPEYSCAASEALGAGSVAFVQRDSAPVKLRLSLWQRFQLRRAKRSFIMVQPK